MPNVNKIPASTGDVKVNWFWLWCPIVFVLGVWFFTPKFIHFFYLNTGYDSDGGLLEAAGQYGDQYGYINALFSGLAFSVLIFTMYLQRIELSATRDELRGQKEQFAKQNDTLLQQKFENTFFEMLKNLGRVSRELTGRVLTPGGKVPKQGIEVLSGLTYELRQSVRPQIVYKESTDEVTYAGNISGILTDVWDQRAARLTAIYLDMIFLVLKHIHHSEVNDKDTYMHIFRSSLSIDELEAIYLFSIVSPKKELQRLLNDYHFFDAVFENFHAEIHEFGFHYNNLTPYAG